MAFGPADPPPDQVIRLAHFTADEPVAMDPAHRDDPEDKLAGVQLGHFAAFLKRSWRANDWMWGRLDAAERLVRLLDEACGHQLATSGRLDHHIRALQAAALRDLLPVVAVEIEVDGLAGARRHRRGAPVRRRHPRRPPDPAQVPGDVVSAWRTSTWHGLEDAARAEQGRRRAARGGGGHAPRLEPDAQRRHDDVGAARTTRRRAAPGPSPRRSSSVSVRGLALAPGPGGSTTR